MMAMSMAAPARPVDPTAHLRGEEATAYAKTLPLTHRFTLGDVVTDVQRAFLDRHGYAVFGGVVKAPEIARLDEEVRGIQERWLAENRKRVYGIPLFVGKDEHGAPFIQRFAFTSVYSDYIRDLVRDRRFEPIRTLIGEDARVGDEEKDGVVFNRNLNVPGSAYPRLGWHTDGLRSLAYGRMPGPMLNVGIHLDRVTEADGGLRIIPGTHHQGFWKMCFHKPYFVSHGADRREVAVETEPGDLTVHDGRTWHRVQQSPHVGARSLRRTMYVPYLTDAYQPKREDSPTPFYHHIGRFLRYLKRLRA
ncbi:MAG: phytanoyl-CoA dioxygenase family protein [Myxococcota bacterium]|nr:phytanoyl-CoA dioxygenase family protein [Myxococcota bacterium]